MGSKIGRNEPCPCGSGKKYKKCCNKKVANSSHNLHSETNINSLVKLIGKYNRDHLLNFLIGIQLIPENHGKNTLIEKLITHVVTNKHDGISDDFNEIKSQLDIVYESIILLDIPQNLFTENIVFFGGNYTVFPGTFSDTIEIFNTLKESIFLRTNDLPGNFIKFIADGVQLILELGKILSIRNNLNHNLKGGDGESKIIYPNLDIDSSFSEEEVNQIFLDFNLEPSILDEFIISSDNPRFSFENPDCNPLLNYPIVLVNNRYYFTLISNQVNTINEFILRASNQFLCNDELVRNYHKKLWYDLGEGCEQMGWIPSNIALPKNKDISNLKEKIFQFDVNRLAYVSYLHNDKTSEKYLEPYHIDMTHVIEKRKKDVVNYLKNNSDYNECQFFSLVMYESMGRFMSLSFEAPVEKEISLGISAHKFIHLTNNENWDSLSLWKFAKSYSLLLKKTRVILPETIDIYSIYKSNNNSFYFGDDSRPTLLDMNSGYGSNLIGEYKIKKNVHGILMERDKQKAYLTCERSDDYAPIYKPIVRIGYYAICLKLFDFPIWITNKQTKNNEIIYDVGNFANAIAYWVFKLKPSILEPFNLLNLDSLELELIFDENIFEDKSIVSYTQDKSNINYKYRLIGNIIQFHIPYSKIKSFIRTDNIGEMELIIAVLDAFNSIDNHNIPIQFIKDSFKKFMPSDKARMIVMTDTKNEPLLDNRWLIRPIYISNSEIDYLLDTIPKQIERKRIIPRNFEDSHDKKNLFNDIVNLLLEKLQIRIKNYKFKPLLNTLVELNEAQIWEREFLKVKSPADMLCFGEEDEKILHAINKNKSLIRTSLSTRCLIEYLVSQPTKGNITAGYDEIDELLAIMHEIIYYGFQSDAIHFKLSNPSVGILESGRIGISTDFYTDKLKPFSDAHWEENNDNLVVDYQNRFDYYDNQKVEDEEFKAEDEEIKQLDSAFFKDWGVEYINIHRFCYACNKLCEQNGSSTITIKEIELIHKLVDDFELPYDQMLSAINKFSIQPRVEFLEPPAGYELNEVQPWKYNREFSYVRRFIIQHYNEEGQNVLTWGLRNSISAINQLDFLLYQGKLKYGGKNINKLLGVFNDRKGKGFRNKVKYWLKEFSDLDVIDYEVDISPNGHLKSSNDDFGDIDILLYDKVSKIVWSLECKNTSKAKNIHEMKKETDKYFGRENEQGMIDKHLKRHEWLIRNKNKVSIFLKMEEDIQIISCLITSEVIPSVFIKAKDIPFPIIAFPKLKKEGVIALYPNT